MPPSVGEAVLQLLSREAPTQANAHGLSLTPGLQRETGTDLPQVQRQLPAQRMGQPLQMTHAGTHGRNVGALGRVQRPDHAVQRPPTTQALPALKELVQLRLGASTPEQQRTAPFQPELIGQAGGDGVDLFGFADKQQHPDFAAPKGAVVQAQVIAHQGELKGWRTRKH
jgi:hypothetical protein